MKHNTFVLLATVLVTLAACAGPQPTPAPSPTPVARATTVSYHGAFVAA